MTKFSFRLERVRELRERAERERAAALGAALRAEQDQRDALDRAHGERARAGEQSARAAEAAPQSAGSLRNLELTRDAASREVANAADSLDAAGEQLESAKAGYGEARRDLRAVEKLKEKRIEAWREESSRSEQKDIDGIARDRRKTGDQT